MTVSMTSIEDKIRDYLLDIGTNTRVIFHYPNAPRPELPYTSIHFLGQSGMINDNEVFDNDDDLVHFLGCREMLFSINCFGDNAFDEVNTIQGGRQKLSGMAALNPHSVWSMTTTRDLSSLIGDEFEKRAQFDITFNVLLEDGSTTEDRGFFDTVGPVDWANKDDLI